MIKLFHDTLLIRNKLASNVLVIMSDNIRRARNLIPPIIRDRYILKSYLETWSQVNMCKNHQQHNSAENAQLSGDDFVNAIK